MLFVGGQKAADLFGTANTDWQKEIFRLAMATDHNVSVTGAFGYGDELPYRFSAGYTYDQGTLKGSDNQRVTLDINLSPKFFTDHLSVNLNAKGIYNKSNYADAGAVGAAVSFDPTQSPYIYNADGAIDYATNNGFWNWSTDLAPINPFSTLYDKYDRNNSYRALGNLQLDYKIHGFEDLSLNLNLGLDITKTKGDKGNLPGSIFANRDSDGAYKTFGRFDKYENLHRNQLLEFYANYAKEVGIHNINVMAGYSWSMNYSKTKSWNYGRTDLDGNSTLISNTAPSYRNALVSFYGRVNYSIDFALSVHRYDACRRFVALRW